MTNDTGKTQSRAPRKLFVAYLSIFSLLFALTANMSSASTVRLVDSVELASLADTIVHGKIISKRTKRKNGRIVTELKLQIKKALKGAELGKIITVTYAGGSLNGITSITSDMPVLNEEGETVIYLERTRTGALLPLGRALGIYNVRYDTKSGKYLARRDIRRLGLASPQNKSISIKRLREIPLQQILSEIESDIIASKRRSE